MTRHAAAGAFLLACALAPPAGAKIVWTGYADLHFLAHSRARISGPDAILASLGAQTRSERHDFRVPAAGMFATTQIGPRGSLHLDLTFSELGSAAARTTLQYAFLEFAPAEPWTLRAGKITLPLGYYNEHRFYPFRRHEAAPPAFSSGILGLPISDLGASAARRLAAGPAAGELSVYAVNGYGGVPGTPASFRTPSALGLAVRNNLRSADNNSKPAYGARLELQELSGRPLRAGVSYYRGEWDPDGDSPLQLGVAHGLLAAGTAELLFEYLIIDVRGDPGFAAAVGSPEWTTRGYFVSAHYQACAPFGRPLTPFALYERYRTEGAAGGPREKLDAYAAGLAADASEGVRLKLQYRRIEYALPFAGVGDVFLVSDEVRLAAVVAF